MNRLMGSLLFASACALMAPPSLAQSYPDRPIKWVIGFPPGTILDTVARPVADEMAKKLGQPIVIEFKPGANSTIAAKYVVNAEPDGYTLFFGTSSTIHPLLNRNNAVDAGKDMTSIAAIANSPFYVLARASLPVKTLADLVAYSKANPGKLTHGANSATANLLMQMLKARTGIESRGIPYKSSAQSSLALLAGEVDLTAATVLSYLPHIQAGKVRALVVMAEKRSPVAPDVPSTTELGVKDLEMATNMGLWAPPGTPKAIVDRLNSAAREVLAMPSVIERLRKGAAAEPVGSSPEGQLKIFEAESRSWAEAARLANYKAP